MPESRRAGRLSGGKGPPLASTKRGALPPGPPSSPKRALLQETGSHTAARFLFSGGIMTSFGGVLSVGGQCAGRLMRRSRGGTGFVRKRFFGGGRRGRGLTLPSPVMFAPWRSGGGARHPKTGTRHTDQKKSFWEERGSMRGRGDLFSKRSPLPSSKLHCLRAAMARVVC